jgi:hypothetical protein
MNDQEYLLFFRALLGLFALSVIATYLLTSKKLGGRLLPKVAGVASVVFFITLVIVVFKSKYSLPSLEKDVVAKNSIYQDISLIIAVGVRITIISIIGAMLFYLWKRSKKYPQNTGIFIHKILIGIGLIGVVLFAIYETKECFNSFEYREIIPLGVYAAFFAGGFFWMLLCSIVSAASLPENTGK